MLDRLTALATGLRNGGIGVATSAVIDAAEALAHIDLGNRAVLKECIRATMVKEPDPGSVFDRCFDAAFRVGAPSMGGGADHRSGEVPTSRPSAGNVQLDQAVLGALLDGDRSELTALAQQAVDMFAGDVDDDATERRLMNRVMRAIDLSRMLSAAMRQLRHDGELDGLELALQRTELSEMIENFRRELAAEIARRLEGRDLRADAASVPEPLRPEDADLLALSSSDQQELRRIVQPLLRRLAIRIGQKRKRKSAGRLDLRRTVRRSLQTGGVPLDVVQRRRHPHRPDVVVLCDVSGSVAEFAQFTFTLINALHTEVRNVRSFAFVDGVAEVSDVFDGARFDIAVNRLVERRGVVGLDGHSNYGAALQQFADEYLEDAVGSGTTVLISGDARSNYRDDGVAALEAISRRARRVYWLNPEPTDLWGTTDSVIEAYRPSCTSVYEVRTLGQLSDAIADIV